MRGNRLTQAIENLDVHDHICLIYETREEQFATVIPFVCHGLQRNEQCLYIVDDATVSSVREALMRAGINVDERIRKGDLSIVKKRDIYLKRGDFDPAWMVRYLKDTTSQALKNGYHALRIAAEMTWCLELESGYDRIIHYESMLNEFFPKHKALRMCQYNVKRFDPAVIKDILYVHPFIAFDGIICKNYYFIPHEEFQDNSNASKVRSLLKNIVATQKREEKQKKLELALQQSEDHYRALIENSSDVITLSDGKGHYSYISPSIQTMLGYSPQEFINLDRNTFVHPEDLPIVIRDMSSLISRHNETVSAQFRIRHKNGSWRWVESRATNLLNYPSVKAIVSNLRDVTERENLLRQKDEFLAIASHELKTPVTSIKAYTQILQRAHSKAGDMKYASLLGKLDSQLNKLIVLISDLLDVTKLESGGLKFSLKPIDFSELITEVVEEMQNTTTRHSIETDITADIPPVLGDRERLSQVLINLISNAIKYSPTADRIVVKASPQGNALVVSVQDFGIGLDQDDYARVFERFYRVNQAKHETYPGLGLGLYISAEIIERHHGNIWVEAKKGEGSIFYFTLPL